MCSAAARPFRAPGPTTMPNSNPGRRSFGIIAALPPDVRKGSAFPYLRLNLKVFRLGRFPESRRLSASQAAQPQPSSRPMRSQPRMARAMLAECPCHVARASCPCSAGQAEGLQSVTFAAWPRWPCHVARASCPCWGRQAVPLHPRCAKNQNDTNKAVMLLKTNKTDSARSVKAVRCLKTKCLGILNRYLVENNA